MLQKFKNYQMKNTRVIGSRRAFTLVELVLATALIVTVSVVGFFGFFRYRNSQNLKLAANELAAVVRDTQKKSVTQQDGKRWGIHLENNTDGNQRFSVFNGSMFGVGSTTQTTTIRSGVLFGIPTASSTYDISFAPITGIPLEAKVITLFSSSEKGSVGDILVNTLGKTTLRFDFGLIGYWHLDESTSTAVSDASGNGNNGTLINNPTWQSATNCKAGSCLNFNGSSYVNFSTSTTNLSPSSGITLSAWVYQISWANYPGIITKGYESSGEYSLHVRSNNSLWFELVDDDGVRHSYNSTDIVLGNNVWNYVAATYDGSKQRIYINGREVGTGLSGVFTLRQAHNNVRIGSLPGYGYFNGFLDEVRIYNRALSATEIRTIYEDLK